MLQANVSTEEYSRMYQVYLQSVHQTEAMRDLRYYIYDYSIIMIT